MAERTPAPGSPLQCPVCGEHSRILLRHAPTCWLASYIRFNETEVTALFTVMSELVDIINDRGLGIDEQMDAVRALTMRYVREDVSLRPITCYFGEWPFLKGDNRGV